MAQLTVLLKDRGYVPRERNVSQILGEGLSVRGCEGDGDHRRAIAPPKNPTIPPKKHNMPSSRDGIMKRSETGNSYGNRSATSAAGVRPPVCTTMYWSPSYMYVIMPY